MTETQRDLDLSTEQAERDRGERQLFKYPRVALYFQRTVYRLNSRCRSPEGYPE